MIIAAYAGTGKTALAKARPDRFVDFVCVPYKYESRGRKDEGEAGKANPDDIMQSEWPYNYVDALIAEMRGGKHMLIPSDRFVLTILRIKNIPYILCFPERSAKDEYLRRYLQRGNTKDFTDVFIGRWDKFIDGLEKDEYGHRVVLKAGEFLSDVLR